MLGCRSFSEKPPIMINSKTRKLYQLFRIEPMHVLDLRISKDLKIWLFSILGSVSQMLICHEENRP